MAEDLTLLISDGGLPALVASHLDREGPPGVVLWLPPIGQSLDGVETGPAHAGAVRLQARALAAASCIEAEGPPCPDTATLLMAAARAAAGAGCARVAWPVVCGSDGPALFRAAERAALVSRLVALEHDEAASPGEPVQIEIPLADLDDHRVAEMALDMDAPHETCWWYQGGTAGMPEAVALKCHWEAQLATAAEVRGFILGDRRVSDRTA